MIVLKYARALVLAFIVLAGNTIGHAHSLPGSVLTFSEEGERLNLIVTFPIEDLVIAANQLNVLESRPQGQDLPQQDTALLAEYFQQHLIAQKKGGNRREFALQSAQLKTAYHHDLGEFILVESRLSAPLSENEDVFPFRLSYDAVMHEVRNHRATVYYSPAQGERQKLANFGYRKSFGVLQTHTLTP